MQTPLLALFAALLTTACSSQQPVRHPDFVEGNVSRLRTGMSPADVEALLGPADEIQERTCGGAVDEPWPCTAWIFSMAGGYTNLLVFDTRWDPPRLDGWHLGHVLPVPDPIVGTPGTTHR